MLDLFGLGKRYWLVIAAVVLIIALIVFSYTEGKDAGASGEVTKQQERELDVQGQVKDADTKAGDTRVTDAVRAEQQQKELEDAFKASDDPERRRVLRGCVIMRQQGRDTSRLPECRGHAD